jgi:hypothetical protein
MRPTNKELRELMAGELILRAVDGIKCECPKCKNYFRLEKSRHVSVPTRRIMMRGRGITWSNMPYPQLEKSLKEINAEMERRGAGKAKVVASMRRRARRLK